MSLTAPNPIVKPFCNSGTQVSPPVGADTFVANQETGFPDSQATPLPAGTEVQQNQMNGVLKLYTSLLLWLNSGGQFTFNQAFSDANNGYALDNILWCASNSTFQRSLVANNTANFVTTPSYINDGINWIDVNNASFPDIQNNPTTGDVTIGGRIANSVNNIKTLNDEGKESGLVTTNDGNYLYVTEPDGETINTAVVNQYGYRLYSGGTATAILDPAITYAYVSELPVVTNNIKVKSIFTGLLIFQQLQAVYDGEKWGCTVSGSTPLNKLNSIVFNIFLDVGLLGISGTTYGQRGVVNVETVSDSSGLYITQPSPSISLIQVQNSTEIAIEVEYPEGTPNIADISVGYSITFTATSIT